MADVVTDWTPNEIAAAKKLAGADADKMCVAPATELRWTPDGPKMLTAGDEVPFWTCFAPFVREALNLPAYVEPERLEPVADPVA